MGVNELLAGWDLVFDLFGGEGVGGAGVPLRVVLSQAMASLVRVISFDPFTWTTSITKCG